MICWKRFRAARAYFKKNILGKMSDILKISRAARLFFKELTYKYGRYISKFLRCARLFLKNVCIKISDTFKNFPRCAQLFLKNSLATMDGIIWICKVSKSSTLARLIITYLYFLQNVNIFMFRKISGESIFEIYPNKSGRPKFIFISTLWKKISCWKHFGMLGFSNKKSFSYYESFSVL